MAGEPGAALPGNAIAGSPYGQAVFAAGVLRSPAATFSDASRVSIGTLDLRDTSTQLTFDNTSPTTPPPAKACSWANCCSAAATR